MKFHRGNYARGFDKCKEGRDPVDSALVRDPDSHLTLLNRIIESDRERDAREMLYNRRDKLSKDIFSQRVYIHRVFRIDG